MADPPKAEVVITDIEQLKVISDPLRLRLLEVMSDDPIRPWTAKEIAAGLGTKQTKLYHHLGLLEEHGFVRVAETRVVSGILEKRYQVVARSYRVDRSLLGASGAGDAVGAVLDAVFDKARDEILAGQRAGLIDMGAHEFERRRMAIWSTHARLSPTSVRKVMRQIERLAAIDASEDPDGAPYGLVLAFYPRATERDSER